MKMKAKLVEKRKSAYHSTIVLKKNKLSIFSESQLLKGLTAKKAHADEIIEIKTLNDFMLFTID